MMKSIKLVVAIVWILCIPTSIFAEEKIRITIGEWPPFISEHLKHYGVISHIVTEAFALEGIKVEYGFFPWKRAYIYAEKGKWDGTAGWSPFPERGKVFYMSNVIHADKNVFFHLKSYRFDWNTIDDLKGIPIGGTIGFKYGEEFENAKKAGKIKMQYVAHEEYNFSKLLLGRIKIFPDSKEVGYFLLHKHFSPEEVQLFTHHPKHLYMETMAVLLSKKIKRNQRMIQFFNRGFQRLKDNGMLDQYLAASLKGEYIIEK